MTPAGEPIPGFEFATAARIVFGPGTAGEAGRIAREFGARALIVTGRHPERARGVRDSLNTAGVSAECFPVAGEPTVDQVRTAVEFARSRKIQVIVGFGGGSAVDAAKAIAALVNQGTDLFDHLEVVGHGLPLSQPALPWIAIPTTAGAGAEVTRNAVLTSPKHRVKASLRSPRLLARVAIVDPRLALGLPPGITAATGVDALTQLIEPFLCTRANPLVDALCRDGIPRIVRSLRNACENGADLSARTDLALAALCGGLALANAGLGVVHGLAAPIGGAFPSATHGAVCAALLPHALRLNLAALRARQPTSPTLERFREIARLVTGRPEATADDGPEVVARLVREVGIAGLTALGVERPAFAELAEKAAAASSMKANPLPLEPAEILGLLEAAA